MLEEWIAASRDRFTGADFEFLNEVLAGGEKRVCMAKLWEDPEALREMLDLKEVLRGLLDSPSALRVSPDFYFYVLVRHAFMQADISNPDIADYVAGVLAKRIGGQADDPLQDIARGYTHASDFLAVISSAHGRMKFHLQVAAGNQFMVLTGMFPVFISRRNERCCAPDIGFYKSFFRLNLRRQTLPGGRTGTDRRDVSPPNPHARVWIGAAHVGRRGGKSKPPARLRDPRRTPRRARF